MQKAVGCVALWSMLGCTAWGQAPSPEKAGPGDRSPAPGAPTLRVAGIVLKWIRGDREANLRRVEPMIREAAAHGAKIVVTTECFLDGYAIADKKIPLEIYQGLGEPIPEGKYFRRLAALAAELKIHLVAGLHEVENECLSQNPGGRTSEPAASDSSGIGSKIQYNAAVLIDPDGKLIGKYRKQELGHELERNRPGTQSLVFPTPYGRVGVMICADRTKPAIVERFRQGGADFLLCPSGGMFGPKTNDPILQARSRENARFIVFVHPAEFLVTGPDGSIVARTLLGATLLVAPEEAGGPKDLKEVFYIDLPMTWHRPGGA